MNRESHYSGCFLRKKNATNRTDGEREQASIRNTKCSLVGLFTQERKVAVECTVVIRLPGHVKDDAQDALVEQVRSQLNATLAPFSLTLEAYGTYGRWYETPSMPPVRRRSFVFGLHQQ